jgi:hypothetical protein
MIIFNAPRERGSESVLAHRRIGLVKMSSVGNRSQKLFNPILNDWQIYIDFHRKIHIRAINIVIIGRSQCGQQVI